VKISIVLFNVKKNCNFILQSEKDYYICITNNNKNAYKMEITFTIKTSTGLTETVKAENLTKAQEKTIKLLKNEGDYLEIKGLNMIHRTTKQAGAYHWNHEGYKFDSYDKLQGIKQKISLFTK
jgi:hypothetical protein